MYVDNIKTAASHESAHAIQAIKVFEPVLNSRWALSLKDGSPEIIIPEPTCQQFESDEYPRKSVLTCLGHQIAASGSLTSDWALCKKRMSRLR